MSKTKVAAATNGLGTTPMPAFDMEPLIALSQRSMAAASEAQRHMFERMTRISDDISGFVSQRLEEDQKAAKKLSACKGAQEAFVVYGEFFETAVKQYSEEAQRLTEVYADQTRETMEDVQHQISEAVEPVKNGGKSA